MLATAQQHHFAVPTGWNAVDAALGGKRHIRGARDAAAESTEATLSLDDHKGGLARGMVHEWFGIMTPDEFNQHNQHDQTAHERDGQADSKTDSKSDSKTKTCREGHQVGRAMRAPSGGSGVRWLPPLSILAHLGRQALLDGLLSLTNSRRVVVWIGESIWPHPRLLRRVSDLRDPRGDDGWMRRGYRRGSHEPDTAAGNQQRQPNEPSRASTAVDDRLLEASIFVRTADAAATRGDPSVRTSQSYRQRRQGAYKRPYQGSAQQRSAPRRHSRYGGDEDERVWAMDLAARCPAVAAVIGDGRGLSMAQTRRLQLAAEGGGAIILLARAPQERGELSAAGTRWWVTHTPSMQPNSDINYFDPQHSSNSGSGPCWQVTLLRHKATNSKGRGINTDDDHHTHDDDMLHDGVLSASIRNHSQRADQEQDAASSMAARLQALGVRRGASCLETQEDVSSLSMLSQRAAQHTACMARTSTTAIRGDDRRRFSIPDEPEESESADESGSIFRTKSRDEKGLTSRFDTAIDVKPRTSSPSALAWPSWRLEWNHATGDVCLSPYVVNRSMASSTTTRTQSASSATTAPSHRPSRTSIRAG